MKNVIKTNGIYIDHLIDSLSRIQNGTLEYIAETGRDSPMDVLDCICFFNSLKKKCSGLLPEYYVKNVVLVSDYSGTVRSVEYEYYAPGESISAPGIRICSDSYIDKTINPALSAAV